MILFLNFESDYESFYADHYLESNQNAIIESLELSLPILVVAERKRRDEAQTTSLIRALLELSGGRVDLQQPEFAEEYTASNNADLYASVLGIMRKRHFGDFDSEAMRNALSKSPLFSEMIIDLEEWITEMMDFLPVGFRKGYLVRCPEVTKQSDANITRTFHREC